MYKYDIIREEIIPGSLEDFRALMHEIYELQPQLREDRVFLQGERTPPDYPENAGRWEVTLGGTLQQRGFILARQLPNGTTKLQFAYHSKFQPIGSQFDIEFVDYIMKQDTRMNLNVDVLIITVTRVESRAVVDVFEKVTGQVAKATPIDDRVYHDLSVVNGARVFMVQSEMGSGGLGASHQTVQKGIAALSPTAVIMVGIAFGVNADKQSIGDVLVSQQLMLYELQRVGTEEGKLKPIPRGDRPHASSRLINLFQSADLYWDESKAKVRFGLILSGEKLVDNVDFQQQLREFEPEAIGGEMEGSGLYVACQDAKVDWILVKSICDWADGNKVQNKDEQQRLAAHNAASFVLHVIQYAPLNLRSSIEKPYSLRTSSEARMSLTREQVEQLVKSAREKGKEPDLRELELTEADLMEADLAEVDLSKANLSFSDLEQANLGKAKLVRANLRGARLYRTHLKGADLKRAELMDANLFRPTLAGADLSEVDLSKAKVELEGADLRNAKLFETNLDGINLNKAILDGAECSLGTIWPENFDYKRAGVILRMSCDQYGIKIKHPQNGYIIREPGNIDINVIGIYKEKPPEYYLCICVANKDREIFWRYPERIAKFDEDSREWSATLTILDKTEYYEIWILAALVTKEGFEKGEYSSLPPNTVICDEVLVGKGAKDKINRNVSDFGPTQQSRWRHFSNK